jgi:hypothetical protein
MKMMKMRETLCVLILEFQIIHFTLWQYIDINSFVMNNSISLLFR